MSDLFALDPEGNDAVMADARANPARFTDVPPGAFDNAPQAIGMGVMRGGVLAGRALSILASAPVAAFESLTNQPGKYTDSFYKETDDSLGGAIDYWTPDTHTTGFVGRTLGGFGEIVLPLMAGGGNPSLMIASTETNTAADLVKEGVNADTAVQVGVLQGTANAVGFRLPFLGKTLLSRMGTGAVGNTALNAGSAAASNLLLNETGNTEAAKRFDPTDLHARAVDVLSGLAFGGIEHLGARSGDAAAERVLTAAKLSEADKAAVATALNARHFQDETAPGRPADTESFVAHQDAMEQATMQLLRGDRVTVPEAVTQADFVPREREAAHLPDETTAELRALDDARDVESRIAKAVDATAPIDVKGEVPPSAEPPRAPEADLTDHLTDADPVVTSARQAATELTSQIPTGEFHPDGTPKMAMPADILAAHDAAVTESVGLGKAIAAAVGCFLRTAL